MLGQNLGKFLGNFGEILENFRNFWEILGIFGNFWEFLGPFGRSGIPKPQTVLSIAFNGFV